MKADEFRPIRCRLAGVEAVAARSPRVFPPHTHDQYGIGLVRSGGQKWRSGRGLVEAGAGDTIACNPGEVHDGSPIGDEGRTWTMLYFEPALIVDAVADIQEGRGGSWEFELPRLRDGRIAARFGRLFVALTGRPGALSGEEELLGLLAGLMRSGSGRGRAGAGSVARARERIDDDPAAPLTLADLASEAGLSRVYTVRAFRKATGLTPHAYQVQRRLQLARRLIAHGTSLAESAAEAGFADQSHMTRLFVRNYGFPPGAYARAVG